MSIRNYNAFLREVKRKHGITHKQAQRAYRKVSLRMGRPAIGRDVSRHPRITADSIRKTKARKGVKKVPGDAGQKGLRTIRTIAEWERLFKFFHGATFKDERIVSSADYGTSKKRGRR